MLDSSIDDQLSALGQVPTDLAELVRRFAGEQPLTLAEVDAVLAKLAGAIDPSTFAQAPQPRLDTQGGGGSAPTAMGAMAALVGVGVSAPLSSPPAFDASSLSETAAPLFDSRPPPPSVPPPVFETRSVPVDPASDPSSVFDDRPDTETTAEAIVAAFFDSDAGSDLENAPDPLESLALQLGASSPVEIQAERPRRVDLKGSRRPDLDELLDEPLDALDFERTERVPAEKGAEARTSDVPQQPQSGASGDDFEILVDDEILEIAEDDVELVDDDSSN